MPPGHLTDLYEPQAAPADAVAESFMHIEVDEQTAPELLEQVAQSIEKVLTDVRFAVEDWQAMRAPMLRILDNRRSHAARRCRIDEVSEARDFLLWLNDDNFTFLGYRRYRFEGDGDEARLAVVPGEGWASSATTMCGCSTACAISRRCRPTPSSSCASRACCWSPSRTAAPPSTGRR